MITSNRCILRPPCLEDAQTILSYYLQNKSFLAPWDPEIPNGFYTLNYWQDLIPHYIKQNQSEQGLRLLLFLKDYQAELVGMINFTSIERGPFQSCRLGYKLSEKFQGQGYMSECLKEACEYVFCHLDLHRIEANYIPENKRSENVLMGLGFEKIGLAKSYLKINGRWQDHIQTQLIKKEKR